KHAVATSRRVTFSACPVWDPRQGTFVAGNGESIAIREVSVAGNGERRAPHTVLQPPSRPPEGRVCGETTAFAISHNRVESGDRGLHAGTRPHDRWAVPFSAPSGPALAFALNAVHRIHRVSSN